MGIEAGKELKKPKKESLRQEKWAIEVGKELKKPKTSCLGQEIWA